MWPVLLLTAGACGGLTWIVLSLVTRPSLPVDQAWAFEEVRRARLESACATYRIFLPLIDEWIQGGLLTIPGLEPMVERSLRQRGSRLPWRPAEYLASSILEGLGCGAAGVALIWVWTGSIALWLPTIVMGTLVYLGWALWSLQQQSRRHVADFIARLPFALDGMAMLLQVGAGLEETLGTLARESGGHAVGFELTEMNAAIRRGVPFRQAVEDLRNRFDAVEIREPLGAINSSSELGTPLSEVLRVLAQQMRLKRMQNLETIAARAQVAIQFPAFLILLACTLVIMVPFVAPVVLQMLGSGF